MPAANRHSVRLRIIGSTLRKARDERGMTVSTAARRYGRSKSWFSTLENGQHSVDPLELLDILDFYGVTDFTIREALVRLAEHDHDKNWQRIREGRISAAAIELASLEEEAVWIRNFEPSIVPGLLQIPAYSHGIYKAAGTTTAVRNVRPLVEFRMSRQRVLTRPTPPRYQPIIGEAVLRNLVGDSAVMNAQLQRIIQVAQLDNIELHVLPTSASVYLCLAGPFHLVTLRPPGELTISVVEQFSKSLFVADEEEVAAHVRTFDRLLAVSLDQVDSLKLIKEIASRV
jgi:transcriptional regulator with XRE-family HTH domain